MKCHQYCYECIEDVRIIVSGILFASGITLILDISIAFAAIGQIIPIFIAAFGFKFGADFMDYQNLFIHLLMLFILIDDIKKQKHKRSV
jgi:hypothetical protein